MSHDLCPRLSTGPPVRATPQADRRAAWPYCRVPHGHSASKDACHMVVLTDSIKCKLNCGDRQAGTLRGKEMLPVLVVGGFKVHECQNSSHSFCVDGPLPRKNGGWGTTPTLLCPTPKGFL